MDFEYWQQPERTREQFMAKLTEETGEVADELSRILKHTPSKRGNLLMIEELDHVIHIASCWQRWMGSKADSNG